MAVKTEVLSFKHRNLKVFFVFVFFNISKPKSFAMVVAVDAEPPFPNTKIVFPFSLALLRVFSNFSKSLLLI